MKKSHASGKEIIINLLSERSRILDIGGGKEGLSFFLASKGHELTLFEESGEVIAEAWKKCEEQGVRFKNMFFADTERMRWRMTGEYDCLLFICPEAKDCEEKYMCAFENGITHIGRNGIIFAEMSKDERRDCEAFEKIVSENETIYFDDNYYIGRKM